MIGLAPSMLGGGGPFSHKNLGGGAVAPFASLLNTPMHLTHDEQARLTKTSSMPSLSNERLFGLNSQGDKVWLPGHYLSNLVHPLHKTILQNRQTTESTS